MYSVGVLETEMWNKSCADIVLLSRVLYPSVLSACVLTANKNTLKAVHTGKKCASVSISHWCTLSVIFLEFVCAELQFTQGQRWEEEALSSPRVARTQADLILVLKITCGYLHLVPAIPRVCFGRRTLSVPAGPEPKHAVSVCHGSSPKSGKCWGSRQLGAQAWPSQQRHCS